LEKIYKEISEELNIDEEVVRKVIMHICNNIVSYIQNPSHYKFLINKFAIISPRYYAIRNRLKKNISENERQQLENILKLENEKQKKS